MFWHCECTGDEDESYKCVCTLPHVDGCFVLKNTHWRMMPIENSLLIPTRNETVISKEQVSCHWKRASFLSLVK